MTDEEKRKKKAPTMSAVEYALTRKCGKYSTARLYALVAPGWRHGGPRPSSVSKTEAAWDAFCAENMKGGTDL